VDALLKDIMKEDSHKVILLYHSMSDEVYTHSLIEALYSSGRTVLLPTVVGEELELHIYVGNKALENCTTYDIQESNGPLFTDYNNIDLAIIPGVAFTKEGKRMGRGKGYYDRLLPKLSCPLYGLAFPFQILDDIPTESHDVTLTKVYY